ncbi:hypothetical protein EV426DRAFT_613478 [Tirmania nivea]|nr:hypothetical protein EV426DRAFT_613478 [Tirmania nivea]
MDSPGTSTASSPSSAAEQARIRRERRQAKLKAEGGSRLNKITSTQSNSRLYETATAQAENGSGTETPAATPAPVVESSSIPSPSSALPSAASAQVHDDPEDVILSEHYYQPAPKSRSSTPRQRRTEKEASTPFSSSPLGLNGPHGGPSEEELGEMLAQYGAGGAQGGQLPGMGGANDPMMALIEQMMGISPMGAQGEAGVNGAQSLQQQSQAKWGGLWKLLHTLGALFLAIWGLQVAGLGSEFDGSLKQREAAAYTNPNFFYYFAMMELVLQSSRFVIEKGRPPLGSMLVMIGQMIPPTIGNYFITIARYSVIWTTVMSDAFVVVFVLGMVTWWNSHLSSSV